MNNSRTQVFYTLLDLEESEQEAFLEALKHTQPSMHQQLIEMLEVTETDEFSLTKVLGESASALFNEANFTGLLLDKYQVAEQIGKGGMGVVYSANRRDHTYQQDLAIKFIQPDLTQVLGKRALFEEAQLLALLNHPCIAKVFDAGEHQGCVYMVMEKIHGTGLMAYLAATPMTVRQKLHLFDSICDAVEHAHQNQILHGDIKPENVLIDQRAMPKIFDFNITQRHQSLGEHGVPIKALSKAFASPEQLRGEHLTQQSDLFSLGKLLQAMLRTDAIKPELTQILHKATYALPQQRYHTLAAFRQDLQYYIENRPVSVQKRSPWYVLKKLIQRRPVSSGLVCAFTLSVIGFSALLFEQNRQLVIEQNLTQDMVLELTNIIFHGKEIAHPSQFNNMLELTRRSVLANQHLPEDLKQRMLTAMLSPVPPKQMIEAETESQE
ncbi:serine/threonine protein kinase [Alteromonas sp. S015]|uniref:serine/threonine protein kinase n=1 Tax=Alteromonas sp. S015 TaxID=3117401 RepID=UPI002FE01E0E